MLQMMCEHPSWDTADLSSLTLVQYGGSPVQERVARAWLDRGVRLMQGYGMTEASPGVYMATHDGTLAHPTVGGGAALLHRRRAAARRPTRARRRASRPSCWSAGRTSFAGYWNRPEETAASFVDGQWFRTGDVAAGRRRRLGARRRPGQGHVHLRRGERVPRRGGGRRRPARRGRQLRRGRRRRRAVGRGRRRLRAGARGRRADRGRAARPPARPTSPATRCPSYLEFVPELPRNATGKIRRVELRHRAADEHPTPTSRPRRVAAGGNVMTSAAEDSQRLRHRPVRGPAAAVAAGRAARPTARWPCCG